MSIAGVQGQTMVEAGYGEKSAPKPQILPSTRVLMQVAAAAPSARAGKLTRIVNEDRQAPNRSETNSRDAENELARPSEAGTFTRSRAKAGCARNLE